MTPLSQGKKKLLFHVCCAPCSGLLSQELLERFDLTVYFDNPNIWPEEEFLKRASEAEKYFRSIGVPFILTAWDHEAWRPLARGLENEPEKGARCHLCYQHRLRHAAEFAALSGYQCFTTSLLISPWKDGAAIRQLGQSLARRYGVDFLADDFQAENGYGRSRAFAREQGFYRQKYCGCEFSLKNVIIQSI